jgi:hypothetical protein
MNSQDKVMTTIQNIEGALQETAVNLNCDRKAHQAYQPIKAVKSNVIRIVYSESRP